MQDMISTLVIGVGNLFRNDDAAGLHVARQLHGRLPSNIKILECLGEPTELMEAWEQVERVLVIDALASGQPGGIVQRIDVSQHALPASFKQTSTHALGLAEAIELARALKTLPEKIIVFGIEGENFEAGQVLSPAVQEAINRCCEQIETEVHGLSEDQAVL